MTQTEIENDEHVQEASFAADSYLKQAVTNIDRLFGTGYSAANPALVAAMVQTSAKDYDTAARVEVAALLASYMESILALATILAPSVAPFNGEVPKK